MGLHLLYTEKIYNTSGATYSDKINNTVFHVQNQVQSIAFKCTYL